MLLRFAWTASTDGRFVLLICGGGVAGYRKEVEA
jgi:hypothetical protein